jgi:hypothetical protein
LKSPRNSSVFSSKYSGFSIISSKAPSVKALTRSSLSVIEI